MVREPPPQRQYQPGSEQIAGERTGRLRSSPPEFLREGLEKSRKNVREPAIDHGNEKENGDDKPAVEEAFTADRLSAADIGCAHTNSTFLRERPDDLSCAAYSAALL